MAGQARRSLNNQARSLPKTRSQLPHRQQTLGRRLVCTKRGITRHGDGNGGSTIGLHRHAGCLHTTQECRICVVRTYMRMTVLIYAESACRHDLVRNNAAGTAFNGTIISRPNMQCMSMRLGSFRYSADPAAAGMWGTG